MSDLISMAFLSFGALMFFLGKWHERWEWNKLISEGLINNPRGEFEDEK